MSSLVLDLAADAYRRYPGETVTLLARVSATAEMAAGFMLQLGVPEGLAPGDAHASDGFDGPLPDFAQLGEARYVLWTLARAVRPGEQFEFRVHCVVAPTGQDLELECTALLAGRRAAGQEATVLASRGLCVAVAAKGRYLRYLPAVYQESDEFMGRFLMLFESFWGPIVERVDQISRYFDPRTAPPDLLPWLATWVNLTLDPRWPEARRRRLLQAAVPLYRQRGTKAGLQEYLEIFADARPRIIEHGGQNFRLGSAGRLGREMALGTANQPHTFTVVLPVPAEIAADPRRAQEHRQAVAAIIAAEKPAHTAFNLEMPTEQPPAPALL